MRANLPRKPTTLRETRSAIASWLPLGDHANWPKYGRIRFVCPSLDATTIPRWKARSYASRRPVGDHTGPAPTRANKRRRDPSGCANQIRLSPYAIRVPDGEKATVDVRIPNTAPRRLKIHERYMSLQSPQPMSSVVVTAILLPFAPGNTARAGDTTSKLSATTTVNRVAARRRRRDGVRRGPSGEPSSQLRPKPSKPWAAGVSRRPSPRGGSARCSP